MNIWGFFPNLALVEYHTKWIRIMRGPGVNTRKFYFKIFFATLCLLVSSLSQIFRILLLLWNNDSSMHWVTGDYSQLGDLLWSKLTLENILTCTQKYSRLRCLLNVKGLVFCFYLGWSGSILQFRNMIKVGSKSWLLWSS